MFSLITYHLTTKYYKRIAERYDELFIVAMFSAIIGFTIDISVIAILINNL